MHEYDDDSSVHHLLNLIKARQLYYFSHIMTQRLVNDCAGGISERKAGKRKMILHVYSQHQAMEWERLE